MPAARYDDVRMKQRAFPIQKEWALASDGVRIALTRYRGGSATRLLIAPGFWRERNVPEMEYLAHHFARRAFEVTTFDFRGHGESEGNYSFGREEWRDIEAVLDADPKGAIAKRKIAVVGFSMGGAIAAVALAKRRDIPVAALVLISSPADFVSVRPRPWKPGAWTQMSLKRAIRPPRISLGALKDPKPTASDAVSKLTMPKLIVTIEDDWLVDAEHGRRLFEAAAPPVEKAHLRLPGSLHADALVRRAPLSLLRTLDRFLLRHAPP